MRRLVLSLLTICALVMAGALVAQTTGTGTTPQNTTGATANTGQSSVTGRPETEQGTGMDVDVDTGNRANNGVLDVDVSRTQDADTTADHSDDQNTGRTTTGTTTHTGHAGVAAETEQGTGVDVDVDTGNRANGAVDVDVNRTTDADTDASGVNETGTLGAGDQGHLPNTASDMPLVALLGFACVGAALSLRSFAK